MVTETVRTFIAVELPPLLRQALEEWQADLRREFPSRAVRWTRPNGIHLTLKFLGDTPTERLPEVKAALARAVVAIAPFDLESGVWGCFPNCRRPRVLWLGVNGELASLRMLWQAVEKEVAPLGWPTEKRGFSPHLTLGRISRGTTAAEIAAVGEAMQQRAMPQVHRWTVDALTFFRSDLRPTGAVYTPLGVFLLGEERTDRAFTLGEEA